MIGEILVVPEKTDFETFLCRPIWNEVNLSLCCLVPGYEKKNDKFTTFAEVGMKSMLPSFSFSSTCQKKKSSSDDAFILKQ
jgi:hypothetical protein